ncbi:MAG: histidine kinase [Taibaiella sp.]|nr:histidine kinase [Taibaiella sp.]
MKLLNKHIHWLIFVLAAVILAKQVLILHHLFGFSWVIAVDDAICNAVVLSGSVWTIVLLIKAYPTKVTLYTYAMIIALILGLSSVFAEYKLLQWWQKSDVTATGYIDWLRNTLPVRFIITWIFYSWIATNTALRKNITALNSRFQQHSDAAALLKEAELFKLRQQLQPHFLYNSLNSISALVMISPDKAQEMIGKLSEFLRGSVKRESEDNILIIDELTYIESYLAIESVRFGDRLSVNFDKQFDPKAIIPPFLFQPILENAIKFGLYGKTGKVDIDIKIFSDGPVTVITVTNPYDPTVQPPRGTGFGLKSIGRRLYLLYARADLLETMMEENYFKTILKIPQHHV